MIAGGGDLEDGLNEERNQQLELLKRSFLAAPAADEREPGAQRDAARLGLLLDLPVARWGFPFLPHHRAVLNVFQPQYTLMFEQLLATPRPWLYAHVLLPGGVSNLASEDYALEPGTKAPLLGTVVEVVAVQREADARLTLAVQGLSRARVLRATQALPYARADVVMLPDAEALLAHALAAQRFVAENGVPPQVAARRSVRRRLLMAAAAAEEGVWKPYEHANLSLSMHLALSQFGSAADAEAARAAEAGAVRSGAARGALQIPESTWGTGALCAPLTRCCA